MAEILSRTVATPSDAQAAVAAAAELPRTLMGGTKAMRAAKEKYLPKEPAETRDAYDVRIARSTLFNAFGKTVADMTGKVFNKPIVLKDDVPAQIKTYAENIDLGGRHLNVFARDVFYDALQAGVGYILVDMPPAPARTDGRPLTVAEEKATGARPYLVYIPVERLIGWKSETKGGAETLTQIRILECVTEPDGDFHEKEVEQVRVLEIGKWQIYRKAAGASLTDPWTRYKEGVNSLTKIALVPVYTNRTGFMVGSPPLDKLAELNVAHWQSQSDQRTILHVARVPILFAAGFSDEATLAVGASSMMRNSNPDAKLTYVEHTGKAIEAGDKDLKNIEFQMQTMGLQLLVPQPGGKTVAGEMRDDTKENSPLAMMARSLGDALETALGFMGEFIGLGEDKGGEVEVNTDFGVQSGAGVDVPNIINAQASGLISKDTAWAELKRRGFLSDSFDAEAEAGKIETEAPALDAGAGKGMDLGAGA